MSYIFLVVVWLYLVLLENVLLESFTGMGDCYIKQDAILLFMIVVRKTLYLTCYSHMV